MSASVCRPLENSGVFDLDGEDSNNCIPAGGVPPIERRSSEPQSAPLSCVSLGERVPQDHPMRKTRIVANAAPARLDIDFAAV